MDTQYLELGTSIYEEAHAIAQGMTQILNSIDDSFNWTIGIEQAENSHYTLAITQIRKGGFEWQ